MKAVSKKILRNEQELPNQERLAVKYLTEGAMSFRKIVGQLNFHLSNAL